MSWFGCQVTGKNGSESEVLVLKEVHRTHDWGLAHSCKRVCEFLMIWWANHYHNCPAHKHMTTDMQTLCNFQPFSLTDWSGLPLCLFQFIKKQKKTKAHGGRMMHLKGPEGLCSVRVSEGHSCREQLGPLYIQSQGLLPQTHTHPHISLLPPSVWVSEPLSTCAWIPSLYSSSIAIKHKTKSRIWNF